MTASAEVSAIARGGARRVPDFFIVGNPKSGTTALYEMLRGHPQIFLPELKEPWFFASDMRPRFQPPRSAPPFETLEDYLTLFDAATPGQRIGEASTAYLWSSTAAARIAELRPDARIIAILREPASFLRSLHMQLLRTHVESRRTSARRSPWSRHEAKAGRSAPLPPPPAAGLFAPRSLRRASSPLPRDLPARAGPGPDLRRLSPRQRGHRPPGAPLPGGRRRRAVAEVDANPTTISMRSQQIDELLNVVSVGRGPASRAVKAAVKALTPKDLRARAMRRPSATS